MLIVGAKGFAKEVLQVFQDIGITQKIAFYDDVNDDISGLLFDQFPIIKSEEEVRKYFQEFGSYYLRLMNLDQMLFQPLVYLL